MTLQHQQDAADEALQRLLHGSRLGASVVVSEKTFQLLAERSPLAHEGYKYEVTGKRINVSDWQVRLRETS